MSAIEMEDQGFITSDKTIGSIKPFPDDAKNQLLSFSNQIQDYLNRIHANVEGYKFSIEKTNQGFSIDCKVKATLQMKEESQ